MGVGTRACNTSTHEPTHTTFLLFCHTRSHARHIRIFSPPSTPPPSPLPLSLPLPPRVHAQSLKEEVDDLRKKESADEKVLQATAEANKRMSDPMRKAIADVKRLREEREAYRLDLAASLECKAATMVVSDRLDALRWEHEILGQRYERLVAERDALARKFREAVHEVQQKAGFKALLLEQKLAVVAEEREKAQLVLGEVLSQANIDVPGKAETLRKGAEGLLQVSFFFIPSPRFLFSSHPTPLFSSHPTP